MGHYVINVAAEVETDAQVKKPVDPYAGAKETLKVVTLVADHIDQCIQNGESVVVHCAMGMERSALCVMWYLHKYRGKTVDQAYEEIQDIRPIVLDRRSWIGI